VKKTRKNIRKAKTIRKKTINNKKKKEKGFDSLEGTPREVKQHEEKHKEVQDHQEEDH
jgi:hypothetical protein